MKGKKQELAVGTPDDPPAKHRPAGRIEARPAGIPNGRKGHEQCIAPGQHAERIVPESFYFCSARKKGLSRGTDIHVSLGAGNAAQQDTPHKKNIFFHYYPTKA